MKTPDRILAVIIFAVPSALSAADFTWNGAHPSSNNMNLGGNWLGGTAPPAFVGSADLIFSGNVRPTPNVDISYIINTLRFSGATTSFVVGGASGITLQTDATVAPFIRNETGFLQTINAPITFENTGIVRAQTGNLTLGGVFSTGSAPGNIITLESDSGRTLTFGTAIGGFGGLNKTGAGTVRFNAAAACNGAITVSDGTLEVAAGFIGISGYSINAGTLRLLASNVLPDTLSIPVNGTLDLNGFTESLGPVSGSGTISLGAGSLTTNQLSNSTFNGTVTGTGTFIKTGANTLTLGGTLNHSGPTNLIQGTLSVGGSNNRLSASSTLSVNSGATLTRFSTSQRVGALSGGGSISGSSGAFLAGINNASTTWTGEMSGAGGFTKEGTGTMTVNAAQSFTGPFAIQGGTYYGNAANAFGGDTSTLTVSSGATLRIGIVNTPRNRPMTLAGIGAGGNGALRLQSDSGTGGANVQGDITLSADSRITHGNTSGILSLGIFSDPGTLALGARSLTLSGENSPSSFQIRHAISGSGQLICDHAGTVQINNASPSYFGPITVDRGTLALNHAQALGTGSNPIALADGSVLSLLGGVAIDTARPLQLTGTLTSSTASTWTGTGDIDLSGAFSGIYSTSSAGDFTISGSGQITGGTLRAFVSAPLGQLRINRPIALDPGAALEKSGPGLLLLGGTAGVTSVDIAAGFLRLDGSERIADTAPVTVAAGATFDLNGYIETVASISGAGHVGLDGGILKLKPVVAATHSGDISSGVVDILAGAGGQTFSTANTYEGPTTISSGGKLTVTANGALSPTSSLNVAEGGSFTANCPLTEVGTLFCHGTIELVGPSTTLRVAGPAAKEVSGTLFGAGNLVLGGSGSASFTPGSSPIHTGTTTIGDSVVAAFWNGLPFSPLTVGPDAAVRTIGANDDIHVEGNFGTFTANPMTAPTTAQNVTFVSGATWEQRIDNWDSTTPGVGISTLDCFQLNFPGKITEPIQMPLLITGPATTGVPRVYKIARTASGISGFDPSWFNISLSYVSVPAPFGSWSIRQTGNDLELVHTPPTFEQWIAFFDLAQDGPGDDPDGDGLVNLIEYLLGGHPDNPADAHALRPTFTKTGSVGEFRFRRTKRSGYLSYSVIAERSTNLAPFGWTPLYHGSGGVTITSEEIDPETDLILVTFPCTEPRLFVRLNGLYTPP
jgi:autotransporter-associated beta strand protein